AFESEHDVMREHSVAAAQIGVLERLLTRAARGERKEALVEVHQAAVEALDVFGRDRPGVARVGEEHLPLCLALAADRGAEVVHRESGYGDTLFFEIVRRQISLASADEAVSGEVDDDAIIGLRRAGKPDVDLSAEVGESRLLVGQNVYVLGF